MGNRVRDWAFIIYPDSMPDDYISYLSSLHVPCAISPLHQPDPDSTEEYKPHYHVVLMFSSVKSYNQVQTLVSPLHGTYPVVVFDLWGYIPYLVHLFEKDKPKYDISDIVCLSGADVSKYFQPRSSDYADIATHIVQWCQLNDCSEWYILYEYAMCFERDWFLYLTFNPCQNIDRFLRSKRNHSYGRSSK